MRNLSRLKPEEVFEQEGYHAHKLELIVDGARVGYAEMEYYGDPFPFYYVSYVSVFSEYEKRGFGGIIVENVNNFLLSKSRAGILSNAISKKSLARGMYERRGWEPALDDGDYLVYNLPRWAGRGDVKKAIRRIELNN